MALQFEESMRALEAHYHAMPPVAVMQLSVSGYDGDCLRLHAPLKQHLNDKGSAFGGSLVSMLTLASWGLVTLRVQEAGLDAEVYVADSDVRYLAPLYTDLQAESRIAEEGNWTTFISTLRARGRARTTLMAKIPLPCGGVATTCRARYVAILRKPADVAGVVAG